jgi:hypothetical protein
MLNVQAPQDPAKLLSELALLVLVSTLICQMERYVVEVIRESASLAGAPVKIHAMVWFAVMRVIPLVVSLAVLFAYEVLAVFPHLVLMVIHAAVVWSAKAAIVLPLLAPHALHALLLITPSPLRLDVFQVSLCLTLNVKRFRFNTSMALLALVLSHVIFLEPSPFWTINWLVISLVKAQLSTSSEVTVGTPKTVTQLWLHLVVCMAASRQVKALLRLLELRILKHAVQAFAPPTGLMSLLMFNPLQLRILAVV